MSLASEVFGTPLTTNPSSYIERPIDEKFKNALEANEYSGIVIYGTSKQGKSSLRRHILPDEFCTTVNASAGMSTEGLYREILNQAQVSGPLVVEDTLRLTAKFGGSLPEWLSGLLKISASAEGENNSRQLKFDVPIDYQSAASAARKYHQVAGIKPIVIDNFHYFPTETQRILATDIRSFEDKGIKLIIMGTWKARDFLVQLNPDLAGRLCSLSIEPWSDEDFKRVINKGQIDLNIELSPGVADALITGAAGNIGLLQRGLREVLRSVGIKSTCETKQQIGDARVVREVYRQISSDLVADFAGQIGKVSKSIGDSWAAGRTRTYYILRAFVEDGESNNSEGVPLARLVTKTNECIRALGVRGSQLEAQAIRSLITRDLLAGQQRELRTPIVSYDAANDRFACLDSWFLFTLRRHRKEIIELL